MAAYWMLKDSAWEKCYLVSEEHAGYYREQSIAAVYIKRDRCARGENL